MKFSDFKNVEDVQNIYPIESRKEDFLPNVDITPSKWFIDDLQFSLSKQANVESEMFFREHFISPFMREAWKRHPLLKLWINRKLAYGTELTGEPDYFISSPPVGASKDPVGKPLLAVAEAKQEDFVAGWGQCLAEMVACQKLNQDADNEEVVIYGIVSAGEFWQFGKLKGTVFTRNVTAYTIHTPAKLLGALDYIFGECEKHIGS